MFGPTLFCVDSCDVMEKQAEMGQQISIVVLLIHRFVSIFRYPSTSVVISSSVTEKQLEKQRVKQCWSVQRKMLRERRIK